MKELAELPHSEAYLSRSLHNKTGMTDTVCDEWPEGWRKTWHRANPALPDTCLHHAGTDSKSPDHGRNAADPKEFSERSTAGTDKYGRNPE